MGNLTKYQALIGELEPYTPSRITIQKALVDANISDIEGEYISETDKKNIAIAAIKVLQKMIVLTSESLGKASQGYNVEKLEDRIKALCKENDLDEENFVELSSISDGSHLW